MDEHSKLLILSTSNNLQERIFLTNLDNSTNSWYERKKLEGYLTFVKQFKCHLELYSSEAYNLPSHGRLTRFTVLHKKFLL